MSEQQNKQNEQNEQKEPYRKVFTFTLHSEDDKDLLTYLEGKKITRNVKQGLRLLMESEKKGTEDQSKTTNVVIDPNAIAEAVLTILKEKGIDSSQLLNNDETSATKEISVAREEDVSETDSEDDEKKRKVEEDYQKLVNELGSVLPGGVSLD